MNWGSAVVVLICAALAWAALGPFGGLALLLLAIFNRLSEISDILRKANGLKTDLELFEERSRQRRQDAEAAAAKEREERARRKAAETSGRKCARCADPLPLEVNRCPTCGHVNE